MPPKSLTRNRRSVRLPAFDYRSAGAYFVTVCTHQRRQIFGRIADEEMRLDDLGRIVEEEWFRTGQLRQYVELDEFVVMPNHAHGILWIQDAGAAPTCRGTARRAPTRERFSTQISGSVPTIIRSFKSAATKRINELRGTPGAPVWQRNYYEHIIRSERSLVQIRAYVVNNPAKWQFDRENPDALKPERPNAWKFNA